MQEVTASDSILNIRKRARFGTLRDNAHLVKIQRWLQSYLSPTEQQALCRLWLFKGGFTAESAVGMGIRADGGDHISADASKDDISGMLEDLQDASCLHRVQKPSANPLAEEIDREEVRYSMHAVVREWSRGTFDSLPEGDRHAILRAFANVMGCCADSLFRLTRADRWAAAAQLLARELLNFQMLRSVLKVRQLSRPIIYFLEPLPTTTGNTHKYQDIIRDHVSY